MKNQTSSSTSFYKISSQFKNELPQKTERLLKAILKQKRLGGPIGHGGLQPEISLMTMSEYFKRLNNIHALISDRFREHIQRHQPGAITATSAENRLSLMLKAMNKDLTIWNACLIQNHSVDILLLDYQIAIEVNGGIYNAEFKMSQDAFKAERIYKDFKVHTMTVENNDIVRMANSIGAQIKNHQLKKGDRKRIKKLYRDILIKTVAYWIVEEDIQMLLLNVGDLHQFKSKIFQLPNVASSDVLQMPVAS